MTIWVARAGKYGERENKALDEGRSFIGWNFVGDLGLVKSREDIQKVLEESYPDMKAGTIKNNAGQLYNYVHNMKVGDYFALPLKSRPAIAIGKIAGDYEFLSKNPDDAKHSRKIKWIGEPIPRAKFEQDLLYSFGSAMTVFTVRRNDAEKRILTIMSGKVGRHETHEDKHLIEEESDLDIASVAKEQISDFIGRKFKGHLMEDLVAEVLRAQGFVVKKNEKKGSDGGADILAGKGDMGFDEPRLCVQVKSSDSTVGSKEYDELKGVMQKFNAQYGLLVSWGGFKNTVEEEARRDFFNVRLWTGEDLVNEIQDIYEILPEEWQAEVPLQRTWSLIEK